MHSFPRLVQLNRDDEAYLERARVIAHQGWGKVHPNPMVGCVLVKNGHIIGEGYHEIFGGPHAELLALERARSEPAGATAYVSLEPCNHFGKTPPCAQALVRAGIRRVVFGATDPGIVSAGGAGALRDAGVQVIGPVWGDREARAENPFFTHAVRHQRPFVALKLAMSLDAKIASASGVRTRITGTEAEREVHRLRTGFDSIMVGAGTVRADNPRLTTRLVPPGREPVKRVLLMPRADVDITSAVLEDTGRFPVHIFCLDKEANVSMQLESSGVHIEQVAADSGDNSLLDLEAVLGRCHELGFQSILCEGGARLAAGLLKLSLVDRLYLFISPVALGGAGLPGFSEDANHTDWDNYSPACRPAAFGTDTLITLDRIVD